MLKTTFKKYYTLACFLIHLETYNVGLFKDLTKLESALLSLLFMYVYCKNIHGTSTAQQWKIALIFLQILRSTKRICIKILFLFKFVFTYCNYFNVSRCFDFILFLILSRRRSTHQSS